MNYYRPSEIKGKDGERTGKWRYTVTNDGRTIAVGYCAEQMCEHETADDAREHFRQYELDHYAKEIESTTATKCEVCGEWTPKAIVVGMGGMGPVYHLCDAHRTMDYVREHHTASDAISSY